MAKLTYWIAEDEWNPCYSLIGRTKKAVLANPDYSKGKYKTPAKKVITYKDAFDLFDWATGEGGGRNCGWTE